MAQIIIDKENNNDQESLSAFILVFLIIRELFIQDIVNSICLNSETKCLTTQHAGSEIKTDQAPNAC